MCFLEVQLLNRIKLKEIDNKSVVDPDFLCVDSALLSKSGMFELAIIQKYRI